MYYIIYCNDNGTSFRRIAKSGKPYNYFSNTLFPRFHWLHTMPFYTSQGLPHRTVFLSLFDQQHVLCICKYNLSLLFVTLTTFSFYKLLSLQPQLLRYSWVYSSPSSINHLLCSRLFKTNKICSYKNHYPYSINIAKIVNGNVKIDIPSRLSFLLFWDDSST